MNTVNLMNLDGFDETLTAFMVKHTLGESFTEDALLWFTPSINATITHHDSAGKTIFVGVNGSQGSGKSTYCELAVTLINKLTPLTAVNLSLDDFYFSQQRRQDLAQQHHGLLATRGVPGTHNTDFMRRIFTALQNNTDCTIPRFDKSTDNPFPDNEWEIVNDKVDIVFIEGWCWGVQAQDESALLMPTNELEKSKDAFGIWRNYVNQSLQNHYQSLYEFCDYWVMLKAPSFDCVYQWRCEQEQKLRQRFPHASGLMNDEQISAFIQHYQRLTVHGLKTLPNRCNVVFELSKQRRVTKVNYNDL